MKKVAVLCFLLSGCAGSWGHAKHPDRCATLDDRRVFWGGVAKGSAVAAGMSGLSTLPLEDDGARIAVAVGGVTAAVVAASSVYVAESSGASWARECSEASLR